jgi:hypothetical protein
MRKSSNNYYVEALIEAGETWEKAHELAASHLRQSRESVLLNMMVYTRAAEKADKAAYLPGAKIPTPKTVENQKMEKLKELFPEIDPELFKKFLEKSGS